MPHPTNDQAPIEVTAAAETYLRTALAVPPLLLPSAFAPTDTVVTDRALAAQALTVRKYAMLRQQLLRRIQRSADEIKDHAVAQGRIAAGGNAPMFMSTDPVVAVAVLSGRVGLIDDILTDLAIDLTENGHTLGRVAAPAR